MVGGSVGLDFLELKNRSRELSMQLREDFFELNEPS